jgi:hypothetical protein
MPRTPLDNNEQLVDIRVDVAGWPPIKNEATSLLAARHTNSGRVRQLLTAAQAVTSRVGWTPLTVDVAFDLVVRGPARPPGDATNYLGGIGDVLQDKTNRPNLDLAHLGDLAAVALYRDDQQIRQISYREESAAEPGYSLRIRPLALTTAPAARPAIHETLD